MNSAIKYTALKHPWFYHYYVDVQKTHLYTPQKLHSFLESMFNACPHHKFLDGPRSSSLKMKSGATLTEIPNNDVCHFATQGNAWGLQGTAHGNVQLHMLQNDPKTIGVEVPLWLDKDEYQALGLQFEKDGPLTGHIDIVRIEDDKIWIWDYKPKAVKEKFADTQVLMYAIMLATRIGLPLENFMCGYFDEKTSYVFKPDFLQLKPILKVSKRDEC
ncbi:PD-(D/E)XK nuclease family protein [Candidatus Woesearchaeota archaeon]|nr:PD-(D/E)XK nuclease family protein [Candidatus Woesearchaeota archaeon]